MKAARKSIPVEVVRPLRAALYLRVSTGRQAEGDVSLPSQRDLTTRHCEREGWVVVDEYVEPGATGTDDRRPAFQAMLDRACDGAHPYDVIVVHSFSRFYRDGAAMELTIRKLRKHGVEVVSMTQPTGKDPSQEMMRQIIGIFDEYTSKENGKNVTRSMLENAKQNFWNGTTPPLGYRIVEAERRGQKIKKKLEVDPVEREVVQLIYHLYVDGDPATGTPPLGIKGICNWLNGRGYRTKRGGTFGIGPIHFLLTNTAYIGRWKYNVRSSKTRERKPEHEIVEVAIPEIIDQDLFDRVQAKLAANNPKMTPPRVVNGPILLTGLATCAHCGGGMTQRTGTSSTGKVYSYYTCASRAQKGAAACRGNSIRMQVLDDKVTVALKECVFDRERLTELLSSLAERRAARTAAVNGRLVSLQSVVTTTEQKLKRLYQSIADGIVELDDLLGEQVTILKADREKAKAALAKASAQGAGAVTIDPEKVEAFSRLMTGLLSDSEAPALKAYLRAILGKVVVGNKVIQIVGSKDVLAGAVMAQSAARDNVRSFIPDWRTRHDSNV